MPTKVSVWALISDISEGQVSYRFIAISFGYNNKAEMGNGITFLLFLKMLTYESSGLIIADERS